MQSLELAERLYPNYFHAPLPAGAPVAIRQELPLVLLQHLYISRKYPLKHP